MQIYLMISEPAELDEPLDKTAGSHVKLFCIRNQADYSAMPAYLSKDEHAGTGERPNCFANISRKTTKLISSQEKMIITRTVNRRTQNM